MADSERRYSDNVPDHIESRLRECCLALPEAYEVRAWAGTRWMVRKRTFAHVLGIDERAGTLVVLSFRSTGDEIEALRRVGHPFFVLGWGRDAMGMVLDADTDWEEVRELVTESFCVLAPKKLIALLDRPSDPVSEPHGGIEGSR
jgi:YjbR